MLARSLLWPLVLLACFASGSEGPSAGDLIHRVLESRLRATVRSRGRLTITGGAQKQKVFQLSILRKCVKGSVHLLWSVSGPAGAVQRILIQSPPQGEPVVWLDATGKGAAVRIPGKRWWEPVMGSHLSVEDLVDDCFRWPHQELTGEETAGGKPCWVIRSVPSGTQASWFALVDSWLDQATLVPVRIVKRPRGLGGPKEIVCRGLRQSGGHWSASSIEVRQEGRAGSTRIVFTGGSAAARVGDSEVDPEAVFQSRTRP